MMMCSYVYLHIPSRFRIHTGTITRFTFLTLILIVLSELPTSGLLFYLISSQMTLSERSRGQFMLRNVKINCHCF